MVFTTIYNHTANPFLLTYFRLMNNMDKSFWEEIVEETGTTAAFNNSSRSGSSTKKNTSAIMDELNVTEEARRLLAKTFLRPMNWTDFCRLVSTDNCTTPYYDNEQRLIASSAPPLLLNNNTATSTVDDNNDAGGGGGGSGGRYNGHKYFLSGSYHGHFAPTDDNDCESNPTTCTGHIASTLFLRIFISH